VSLYVQLPDDAPLLQFIREQQKQPCYDRKYALRLSTEHKKTRACVAIYSHMGLYKEALELALTVCNALVSRRILSLSFLCSPCSHTNQSFSLRCQC
jgi:hypothetical protein